MTEILNVFINCRLQFEAWHCWPGAPERHAYLRNSHRHIFHVDTQIPVQLLDREVEFIEMKHDLEFFCKVEFKSVQEAPLRLSCEHMATSIAKHIQKEYKVLPVIVSVSEDNENGATAVIREEL